MVRRGPLALPLALAALGLLALPARAQDVAPPKGEDAPAKDGSTDVVPPPGEEMPPAEKLDTNVEVKGNRFRIQLMRGSVIEGILPGGEIRWEKLDRYGENFIPAKETDKGAGLRLYYVLNLDGELFLKRSDIARKPDGSGLEIRDLGELTDAQKAIIRDRILMARRKIIEEREKKVREQMAKLRMDDEEEGKEGKEGEEGGEGKEKGKEGGKGKAKEDDAAVKKGEALLEKFPPKEWNAERVDKIKWRETVNGIYRNEEEAEFIDNFTAWKAALERRKKIEEAEKKEKGEGDSGTKDGEKGSGETSSEGGK